MGLLRPSPSAKSSRGRCSPKQRHPNMPPGQSPAMHLHHSHSLKRSWPIQACPWQHWLQRQVCPCYSSCNRLCPGLTGCPCHSIISYISSCSGMAQCCATRLERMLVNCRPQAGSWECFFFKVLEHIALLGMDRMLHVWPTLTMCTAQSPTPLYTRPCV